MPQLVNGRVIEYVAKNNLGLPAAVANIGSLDPQNIVFSQLRDARTALETLINDNVAILDAADAEEAAARIAGDVAINTRISQLEQRVTDIYAVAARVEAVPTTGQVIPGVDTAAGADDWQSWVLVDYGVSDARNGIYTMSGGTPVKVDITYRAGLEYFVDSGDFANSNWRVSDEPDATGAFPIIPWSRAEAIQVLDPSHLHIEANRIRSDLNADYFEQVNGFLDFSAAQKTFITSTGTRLGDLETGLAENNATDAQQQVRLTNLESSDASQNATLTAQANQINGLTTRITTAETNIDDLAEGLQANNQRDEIQDDAISALETNLTAVTGRVTAAEGNIATLQTGLAANDALDATQNTRLDDLTTRLTTNEALDATQNTRLTSAESAINANNLRDDAQDTTLSEHTAAITDYGTRITAAEGAIATNNARDDAQDTTLATHTTQIGSLTTRVTTAEGDIDTLEAGLAANNTRDDGQDSLLATHTATLTDLSTRLAANEALDTTQNGRLTTVEANISTLQTGLAANDAKDATQDTAIATLQTDVAARQTEVQVRAIFEQVFALYNPAYQLLGGAGAVGTRAVTQEVIDGSNYTLTSYTITFTATGYERTNIREFNAPYHGVRPPFEEYPSDGLSYRIVFYTMSNGDGSPNPIVDGSMRVAFHKAVPANF